MTKEEEQKKTEQITPTEKQKPAEAIEAKIESPSEVVLNANKAKTEQPKAETSATKENAIDRLLNDRIKQSEAEGRQIAAQDPDSPEQVKRRKRNALIASIADGLSSMATMYSVSKGAPAPSAVAPTLSEVQKAQNMKDRNTYLELLQGWRKQNNELINNYATYQATAAKNKLAQQRLALDIDTEARRYAKDKATQAYQEALIKLKQEGKDDLQAYREAQLVYKYAELEAKKEYWRMADATARYKADKDDEYEYVYEYDKMQGKNVLVKKKKQKING